MKLSKKILLSISVFVLVIAMSTISFATYTSPYAEPTYLVKYGSRGTGVKWVQDLLKKNGYTIDVDGIFGTKTKNAVKHFQKYNNLSQDGIVGPATRNALKKSVAYLSNKQTGLPTFNRNRTDLIGIIQNCKKYYATNNFYYSLSNGVRSIPADKSKSYNGQYYTDCSNFVSWVLYEYALANGNTIPVKINKKIFKDKQVKRGDIIKVLNQYKQPKKKMINGEWIDTGEKEWWLSDYVIC